MDATGSSREPLHQAYYEQNCLWDCDCGVRQGDAERLAATIAAIPQGVKSILDVGCGNGFFLNALPKEYRTVGVDFSAAALKHVRTTALRADLRALPFADASFDLVCCMEVLEHLPQDTYAAALRELNRVTAQHILITVPNHECLAGELVRCRECGCLFHPFYHVRSFEADDLRALFPGRTCVKVEGVARGRRPCGWGCGAVALSARLLPREMPPGAVCPVCGAQRRPRETGPGARSSLTVTVVRTLLWPARVAKRLLGERDEACWLLAVYSGMRG
jgi:SAM-dependent methyltransferase